MPDMHATRGEQFRKHALIWASLHHFLPAELLCEFCYALTDVVSAGRLTLPQLFEEAVTTDDRGLGAWAVRPRPINDGVGQYLQWRIRYFVWANDQDTHADPESVGAFPTLQPHVLENAVTLGHCDANNLMVAFKQFTFPEGDSVCIFVQALQALFESATEAAIVERADTVCRPIDMPLRALIIKHLGDVAADDDRWSLALELYRRSAKLLINDAGLGWEFYTPLLRGQIDQSIATALRTVDGPGAAVRTLASTIETYAFKDAPVPILNAGHDAYVARSLDGEVFTFIPDQRASLLLSPLLLKSLDLSSAFESWIEDDYRSATRRFWSILRRQIALGSASEARSTKGFYARALFDKVEDSVDREIDRDAFQLAVKIGLQSGAAQLFEKLNWNEKVVGTYVTEETLKLLESQLRRGKPSFRERLRVAVELLRGWCMALPPQDSSRSAQMLRFIAKEAATHTSSGMSTYNIGGRCVEILRMLAERRPEFRAGMSDVIVPAILSKLHKGEFWTGLTEALKVSTLYLDVLSHGEIKKIATAALALLKDTDPTKGAWPIVHPVLDFVATSEVRDAARDDTTLNGEITSTMLRFGLGPTEHTRLLYYLSRFDMRSFSEEESTKLRAVVDDVRKQALTTNSSNSISNIQALLIAAWAAEKAGVQDALNALRSALQSALGERRRVEIAFPYAYDPIILLAQRHETIAREIGVPVVEFRSWLYPLMELIIQVWGAAEKDPLIFASFSFPPATKTNPVIIHNWAFASLALGKSLGAWKEVNAALDRASNEPSLKDSIAVARAIRVAPDEMQTLNADTILSESAEAFYPALGQRLVSIQTSPEKDREPLVLALLQQCFNCGPRGLDAAVLMLAGSDLVGQLSNTVAYKNYAKRVQNDRDLRLALMPFLRHASANA